MSDSLTAAEVEEFTGEPAFLDDLRNQLKYGPFGSTSGLGVHDPEIG